MKIPQLKAVTIAARGPATKSSMKMTAAYVKANKRLINRSLLDCDLDLAEFTVLTPFPGTPYFDQMKKAGRLLLFSST